jgi:hypothetical protein
MALALAATVARSGHELPVYPSYYPHEIEIQGVTPERAGELLAGAKLHAYVGAAPRFAGAAPEHIRTVESLGSFVVVRINPQSPLAKDESSRCDVADTILRDLESRNDFIFHPYPVTPWHGDYLSHIDLAEAAKARLAAAKGSKPAIAELKVKATGALAASLVRPGWQAQGSDWDATIETLSAADLVAAATFSTNGLLAPSWLRTGWFHAYLLLSDDKPDVAANRAPADITRLKSLDDAGAERINLERDLVTKLVTGCGAAVAGYTVKRESYSDEFSAGIQNIAFDAIEGLSSPMFIRTVKLKDFPWNGWLALGVDARPEAAWNPIAGFTDQFGRLTWFALGDPAAIPSPYDQAWVLNRISGVEASPRR